MSLVIERWEKTAPIIAEYTASGQEIHIASYNAERDLTIQQIVTETGWNESLVIERLDHIVRDAAFVPMPNNVAEVRREAFKQQDQGTTDIVNMIYKTNQSQAYNFIGLYIDEKNKARKPGEMTKRGIIGGVLAASATYTITRSILGSVLAGITGAVISATSKAFVSTENKIGKDLYQKIIALDE